jgi:general secretion pathway protein F
MPVFRFEAVDAAGEVRAEEIMAASQDEVILKLRDQGLLPLVVEEANSDGLSRILNFPLLGGRQRVSQKHIGLITQQLAQLLKAGLPLDRALTVLISVNNESKVQKLLTRIQEAVRGGSGLADALEAQSGVFTRLYLNMVRAGEAGGSLEVVLERLADFLERSKALKDTVTSALIYPLILLLVAGASVVILLTYVVPQFQTLFDDAGEALPLATQIVIGLGEGVRRYGWLGVVLLAGSVLFFRQQFSQIETRYRWDRLALRTPLIGDLIAKVETARLARTLGTLLRNGVPLLTALGIVREIIANQVLSQSLGAVAENLKAGQGLAEPLLKQQVFPPLAIHMIRVGEETGQLDAMLLQVADTYDGEVQTTVKRLLSLLEPILILGLGLIIAGIIMSILVAIISINDLAF